MASKLIKANYRGTRLEVPGLGLIADWAGSKGGRTKIAPHSGGREGQQGAPIRKDRGYPKLSTDHTGKGFTSHRLAG